MVGRSKNCTIVNPKPISAVEVRTHDIRVRSRLSLVRCGGFGAGRDLRQQLLDGLRRHDPAGTAVGADQQEIDGLLAVIEDLASRCLDGG